ncbi:3100_t:CDS:10 [Acaulospora morrowiae]|uniref:Spindle pole body component n=1 Tax=Acaulospora morrowiae TaxID=94023 RepID=A0A9N9FX78_9GLOM|nr:3100_t:CDS:10 [Acaulospora morrowiae]
MSLNIVNTSIEKLVQHITQTQQDSDNYKKYVKYVHSTFRFGTFGSTSQKEVLRKYKGISEKFRLHAQDSKAEFLDKYVISFMQRPQIEGSIPLQTRYDILCLILNLSESPLRTTYVPSKPIFQEKPKKPEFNVADIFKEEPLTGFHWTVKKDYTEDDEDDTDWSSDVQEWIRETLGNRANLQNNVDKVSDPMEEDHMGEINEVVDPERNYELTQALRCKQYWRSDYHDYSYLDMSMFDQNIPSTLGPSLAKHRSQDARYLFYDPTLVKYITELDAIREVLFMLSGRPSFLFHLDPDNNGKFSVKLNALLMHLTEGAFKSILEVFCNYGNYLAMLRTVSMRICKESYITYGQTTQAFAASILKMIMRFDNFLADLEARYQVNNSKFQDQDTYISLLQLQNQISDQLYEFKILHCFFDRYLLHDFPGQFTDSSPISSPYKLSYKILSGLFDELVYHQTEGNKSIFLMLGEHLDNSFVPFIRMIDEWVSTGVLNDPADEFFIVRTPKVNEFSSRYWSEMYKIRVENSAGDNMVKKSFALPAFLEPLVGRILFSGKAQNLLMSLKMKEGKKKSYSAFQYNPKEFKLGVESLPLFDLSVSNNQYLEQEPFTETSSYHHDNDYEVEDMEIDDEKKDHETRSQILSLDVHIEETLLKHPDSKKNIDENSLKDHNKDDNSLLEEKDQDADKKGIEDKEQKIVDESKQETPKGVDESWNKLLELKKFSDLSETVNTFPNTMSYLFPLCAQPTVKFEKIDNEKTDSNGMHDLILFQPFDERFKERYDDYLQPRYLRIGQHLYRALVEQCHLWRHIRALSGFYFMQQGESMHRLCDILFDRVGLCLINQCFDM